MISSARDQNNEYFDWLCERIGEGKHAKEISFRRLLMFLHSKEFRWSIPKDENRAEEGFNLRYRYTYEKNYPEYFAEMIDGSCSVLEMLVALSIHCEENIMDDARYGDRTSQWFWNMITNLGLGGMYNDRFDRAKTERIIDRFLDRQYEPDGTGGLFYIRNCKYDLREVEIWYQLNWYLDTIT